MTWTSPIESGTFVYSPNIAAYVATEKHGVLALEKDIESFTISRNTGAISTASLTLNNKYGKYDRVITRMNRIVIFLKRTTWLQVFSGYITVAPYWQATPGNITIEAECTLKRIAHTFWDRWAIESQNLFPGGTSAMVAKMHDGGAAMSLVRILNRIARWRPDQIHIQKIPKSFLKASMRAAKLAEKGIDKKALNLWIDTIDPGGYSVQNTPTEIRAGAGSPGVFQHPPIKGKFPGTDPDDFGNDRGGSGSCGKSGNAERSHQGNDLFADRGTPLYAVIDGTVNYFYGDSAGYSVDLVGKEGLARYFHNTPQKPKKDGGRVRAGDVIGFVSNTGNASSTPPHCHFEWHPGVNDADYSGPCNNGSAVSPRGELSRVYKNVPTTADSTSSPTGAGVFSGLETYTPATPQTSAESALLTGLRALKNDESLLGDIKTLTNASLREFQSAPNGDFIAWFPDYFGLWGKTPAVHIRDIEIIDARIRISDKSLATHVYVAGDSDFTGGLGPEGTVDLGDWINTQGVVTVEQEEIMKLLLGLKPNRRYDNLSGWILETFGARPYSEAMGVLRDQRWEFFYALHRFMEKWSAQFLTNISFTFMPEIYPGMRIKLVDRDRLELYVDQVTHTGSRDGGFKTTLSVMAPSRDGKMLPLEREPKEIPQMADDEGIITVEGSSQQR